MNWHTIAALKPEQGGLVLFWRPGSFCVLPAWRDGDIWIGPMDSHRPTARPLWTAIEPDDLWAPMPDAPPDETDADEPAPPTPAAGKPKRRGSRRR